MTPRAEKLTRDPWSARIKRRYHPDSYRPIPSRDQVMATRINAAPIVAVAIDLTESEPELIDALRTTVQRILQTVPDARLACLAVQIGDHDHPRPRQRQSRDHRRPAPARQQPSRRKAR